jgi:hypothetical protein
MYTQNQVNAMNNELDRAILAVYTTGRVTEAFAPAGGEDELHALKCRLERHDWYYDYSDDQRVWRAGVEERDAIVEMTKLDPAYLELYQLYLAHLYRPDIGFPQYKAGLDEEQLKEAIRRVQRRLF